MSAVSLLTEIRDLLCLMAQAPQSQERERTSLGRFLPASGKLDKFQATENLLGTLGQFIPLAGKISTVMAASRHLDTAIRQFIGSGKAEAKPTQAALQAVKATAVGSGKAEAKSTQAALQAVKATAVPWSNLWTKPGLPPTTTPAQPNVQADVNAPGPAQLTQPSPSWKTWKPLFGMTQATGWKPNIGESLGQGGAISSPMASELISALKSNTEASRRLQEAIKQNEPDPTDEAERLPASELGEEMTVVKATGKVPVPELEPIVPKGRRFVMPLEMPSNPASNPSSSHEAEGMGEIIKAIVLAAQ
jgi:hypothetical protein